MILFPYKKIVIETEMTQQFIKDKIKKYTRPELYPFTNKLFIGKVEGNSFTLRIAYKNMEELEVNPFINTKVKIKDLGKKRIVHFGIKPDNTMFLGFFFFLTLFLFYRLFYSPVFNGIIFILYTLYLHKFYKATLSLEKKIKKVLK